MSSLPREGSYPSISFPQALSTEFRVHWRGGRARPARTGLRWSPGPMNSFFTGAANDFLHTLSNFITGKNILSTILSYATVAAQILLLIIILPCMVRTLQQNTPKLATEIHLAILKNKKGGDAGSQHMRSHP